MQRLRDLILSVFILGSIVVVILLIITFFNTNRTIELRENPEISEKINHLRTQIALLEDNECTQFINLYANEIDKWSFNGKANLKNLTKLANNSLAFVAPEKCKISNEQLKRYNFSGKYSAIMALNENILNPYSYEMRIKDTSAQLETDFLISLSYNGLRTIQVEMLEDLINIAKEMEGTHE